MPPVTAEARDERSLCADENFVVVADDDISTIIDQAIGELNGIGYLRRRGEASKVQANREIATFSTIFNRAREWGFANVTNPCEGVRRHREEARERYVTDEEYLAVWQFADKETQDAMDRVRSDATG